MIEQKAIDKMVSDIKQARRLIKEYATFGVPDVECNIRKADMNLHYLLWSCGEASRYEPDMPLED